MATLAVVAYTVMAVTGCSGPASIVLGGGLALSSTAVAMQVMLQRGRETSHPFQPPRADQMPDPPAGLVL